MSLHVKNNQIGMRYVPHLLYTLNVKDEISNSLLNEKWNLHNFNLQLNIQNDIQVTATDTPDGSILVLSDYHNIYIIDLITMTAPISVRYPFESSVQLYNLNTCNISIICDDKRDETVHGYVRNNYKKEFVPTQLVKMIIKFFIIEWILYIGTDGKCNKIKLHELMSSK